MIRKALNDRTIVSRIRLLKIAAAIIIINIVVFQLTWFVYNYVVTEQKVEQNLKEIFDKAIQTYERLKADTARTILKQAVSPPDYTIVRFDGTSFGFRNKFNSYMLFQQDAGAVDEIVKNPQVFLMDQIATAPLRRLGDIYFSLIGVQSYPDSSRERKMQLQLMNIFNSVFADTASLNRISGRLLHEKSISLQCRVNYFESIASLINKAAVPDTVGNKKKGPFVVAEELQKSGPVNSQFQALEEYQQQHASGNDTLYLQRSHVIEIIRPVNELLNQTSPCLAFAVKVPPAFILKKMTLGIIGLGSQLFFLGLCLYYMIYLIAQQRKMALLKNDFISNMSHELKTPIATALAAVQGMQHFDILKNPQKTTSYLSIAAAELQQLSQMVSKILNSTVFESNQFMLNPAEFNLEELIRNIVAGQQLVVDKQVDFQADFKGGMDIVADKMHLHQAISNLVDNAVKYSVAPVNIIISAKNQDRGILITVKDNGPGIPVAYQTHIFDKFFRVPNPADHSVKGHGLGLDYVKTIVEKHGGTITLTSADSSGSTFTLFLPQ